MVTIIARFKLREGKEEEGLALLRTMVQQVQAQEAGALAYVCHQSKDDPSEIVFFELYADDAALQAHGQTPHMGELRTGFGPLFDPTSVKIERLERVAGFVREGAS